LKVLALGCLQADPDRFLDRAIEEGDVVGWARILWMMRDPNRYLPDLIRGLASVPD
jgi:hypothetical protein